MPRIPDAPTPEELDRMVDSVAENPERADFVKRLLKQHLVPGGMKLPEPHSSRRERVEQDDPWDNLPV